MRFEGGKGFFCGHVRHEPEIEFGDCFMRQDRFAAGAGVSANEAFDIDGRLRHQQFQGFAEAHVTNPVLHT